jgi:N6-adenosine-specific RNA methylase IME4
MDQVIRYSTILADPPWWTPGGGKSKRGSDRHYPLMRDQAILDLPVKGLADDNAHLYLWIVNSKLLTMGPKVMEAWGFRYINVITWTKEHPGIGRYFRGQTEQCLFGVRGMLPFKNYGSQPSTWFPHPNTNKHSKKPEKFYDLIESVSVGPYLELFARQNRPGWHAWGNQIVSDIELNTKESKDEQGSEGESGVGLYGEGDVGDVEVR